jgi:hypothetical protein
MTSYSIRSEVPSTNKNFQLEVDSSDWESKMARLVGFEEESPTIDVEAVENSDISQPPLSQPQEVATAQPLSSNPFAKLAVVGGATLAIVMLAGGFLSQMMNTTNQKPKKNNLVSPVAQLQPTSESRKQDLELEIETLKTKLALAEQVEAVKAAQQNLRNGVIPLRGLQLNELRR